MRHDPNKNSDGVFIFMAVCVVYYLGMMIMGIIETIRRYTYG